jgi:hypothetical protein
MQSMGEVVFKSWQEDMAEERAQVALRQTRIALRAVLEERFGGLPEDLVQRLESATDLAALLACIRQAVHVRSLDELQL